MKFAQSSFVYWNFPLQEAIRRLHQLGYQGIEIWGGRPHYYRRDLDGELNQIRDLLEKLEMDVPNFIPAQFRYPTILCSLNESIRKDSVDYIKEGIKTALSLGVKNISLCPGITLHGEPLEKGWSQLKKSILELLDFSENQPINLLIEPAHAFETTLILTVEDGLGMVKEIGHPRLGILIDTGHIHVNKENTLVAIQMVKDIPHHIHIDDNLGDMDSHLIPGTGNFDFMELKEALQTIQYKGFLSVELGFQYTFDPDGAVRESLNFLRRILI
jgi:protein FrlC